MATSSIDGAGALPGADWLRDSVVTLATRGAALVLALAGNVLIARFLGPAANGSFALLLNLVNVASLLVLFGLGSATVYLGARDRSLLPALAGNAAGTALLTGAVAAFGVAALALLPAGAAYLERSGLERAAVWAMALALPLVQANAFLPEVLRAAGRLTAYNGIALGRVALYCGAVVVLCGAWDRGFEGALSSWWLAQVVAAVAALVLARHAAGGLRLDRGVLRQSLGFGLKLYPGNLAQFLNYRLDLFLVAFFAGPAEVGLYAVAVAVAELVWELPHAVRTVLLHRVAATADRAEADRQTARASRLVGSLVFAICLGLALASFPLLGLVYGAPYRPAALALILLLPGVWLLAVGKLLAIHVAGRGRPEIPTRAALLSLAVTVALDLLLIPRFGIAGAAVASSVAYLAATLRLVAAFRRETGLGWTHVFFLGRGDLTFARASQKAGA